MSFLLGNDYFVILAFAVCVFLISYLMSDRIFAFVRQKTLGRREEILELLDSMLVETSRRRVTTLMLLMSLGLGALAFLVFWPKILPGLLFAMALTLLGSTFPRLIVKQLWERRCDRVVDQMVDGMTIMSNGVKAGLSITQSMERVIINMKGPLPQEFNIVLNKIRLGLSVEEALNEMGARIPRQDVQMFVTAVNILKETGGNLAETFATIVTTIRERQKVQKKISAMTAQGLMQGIIITLVPFVLLLVFLAVDPNYVKPLFTKPLGWFALTLMLSLQVIGGVMIKKIVTIKV